jgi:hypothetical protein
VAVVLHVPGDLVDLGAPVADARIAAWAGVSYGRISA